MMVQNQKKGANGVQYAHLELKGSTLSEAQKRMIEMYDEKKEER